MHIKTLDSWVCIILDVYAYVARLKPSIGTMLRSSTAVCVQITSHKCRDTQVSVCKENTQPNAHVHLCIDTKLKNGP